jgi:hypothetical protein
MVGRAPTGRAPDGTASGQDGAVEDRCPDGLFLEPADRLPAERGLPGACRSTWWEDVVPGRTDLPRRLPELGALGVHEVPAGFTAPGGRAGFHFRRTGRPGQGRLTGRPTVGLAVVLISPRAECEAEALRDWADFVHLRHISEVGVPGYTMITPYENATGGDPRFMHFYEMDTDDPESAFQAMPSLVMKHLGEPGTAAWDGWANTPELRIMYVNSFRRLGERTA